MERERVKISSNNWNDEKKKKKREKEAIRSSGQSKN